MFSCWFPTNPMLFIVFDNAQYLTNDRIPIPYSALFTFQTYRALSDTANTNVLGVNSSFMLVFAASFCGRKKLAALRFALSFCSGILCYVHRPYFCVRVFCVQSLCLYEYYPWTVISIQDSTNFRAPPRKSELHAGGEGGRINIMFACCMSLVFTVYR